VLLYDCDDNYGTVSIDDDYDDDDDDDDGDSFVTASSKQI
jgi:hypothetical protein